MAPFAILAAAAALASAPAPPPAALLPGAVNPAVTQATIATTVCIPGWTATVRPPASYTNRLKRQQLAAAGLALDPHAVEEDHVIPLKLGGHPTDPDNLRPQPWDGPAGAHAKDVEEARLGRAVCGGELSLDAARAAMLAWVAEHHPYPDLPRVQAVSAPIAP